MISVILPTFNEAENITTLVDFLDGALKDQPHEIIVVDDDSPDGTWKVATELREQYPSLRVLRRQGKRGLSSAVVDGFDMALGDILIVMDADGQHDPGLLPQVLGALESGAEIAVGSRYVQGGSVGDWVTDRRIISNVGTFFAKSLSRVPISDPLGGFFALKRPLYTSVREKLKPTGFKILLEILAFVPKSTRLIEIPLQFRMRQHGESKLSARVHMEFGTQVTRLFFTQILDRFMRSSRLLLAVATVLLLVFLAPRAWNLRLLLLDSSIRQQTQEALEYASTNQGWLLSGIEVTKVTDAHVHFIYKEHMREALPTQTCSVEFSSNSLSCETPE